MKKTCDHEGFHSGEGRYCPQTGVLRYVLICDDCGQELREVHAEEYHPNFDPRGSEPSRRAA